MSTNLLIIPKRASIVRDPLTGQILPPEGKSVKAPLSPHWKRRLREGGITIAPVAPAVIPVSSAVTAAIPEARTEPRTETRIARTAREES